MLSIASATRSNGQTSSSVPTADTNRNASSTNTTAQQPKKKSSMKSTNCKSDEMTHNSCDDDDNNKVLCRVCVRNALKPYFDQRKDAYNEWLIQRKECAIYFESVQQRSSLSNAIDPKTTTGTNNTNTNNHRGSSSYNNYDEIIQLNERRKVLKEHLSKLQMNCSAEAVTLYKLRTENDERTIQIQNQREIVTNQKIALDGIRQTLLLQQHKKEIERVPTTSVEEKSVSNECKDNETTTSIERNESAFLSAIYETKEKIKRIRFAWAIQALLMYKVQVDDQNQQQQQPSTRTSVTGIGKISGLPLPNKGLELYSFLPPNELQSALRLVACITSIVSSCLAIQLPHPILLRPLQSSAVQHQSSSGSGGSPLPSTKTTTIQSNLYRNPYYKYQDYIDHDIAIPLGPVSAVASPACNNTAARAIQQYHQPQLPYHHHRQQQQQEQLPIKQQTQPIMGFSSLLQSVGNMIVPQQQQQQQQQPPQPQTTLSSVPLHQRQHQRPDVQNSSSSLPFGGGIGTSASMDPEKVRMRLYHSSTAVIAEDSTFQSAYTLKWNLGSSSTAQTTPSKGTSGNQTAGGSPSLTGTKTVTNTSTVVNRSSATTSTPRRIISSFSSTNNNGNFDSPSTNCNNNVKDITINIVEDFVVALQLLQNNIITLCIRAGVPVDRLWPAVAVLLNLNELYLFLCEEIKYNNSE